MLENAHPFVQATANRSVDTTSVVQKLDEACLSPWSIIVLGFSFRVFAEELDGGERRDAVFGTKLFVLDSIGVDVGDNTLQYPLVGVLG